MPQFISPFTDEGFKRIFAQEVHKDLLIVFLNDLLEGEKEIRNIHFSDKEILPEQEGERNIIYDLYCITEKGEHLVVEMQKQEQVWFRDRAAYYLARALSRQGERGPRWKYGLKAVYGVFFINFRLGEKPGKLRTDVVLTDRGTGKQFSDKLHFIFIELPSFLKKEEECKTDFDKWIFILKNMENLDRMPFKENKPIFEKLEKIVDIASLSKEERVRYDKSIRNYRDTLAILEFAEQKGMNEGKKQAARNMKGKGFSIEEIVEITGLPAKDVEIL